jgi:hypothetical protein
VIPSTFVSAIFWKFSPVQRKSQKGRREVSAGEYTKQILMKAVSEWDIPPLLEEKKKWILPHSIPMREVSEPISCEETFKAGKGKENGCKQDVQ